MMSPNKVNQIDKLAPIIVDCRDGGDELLSREWLITNKLGAYCSSTISGCNTRRYHGLLVAATVPPLGKVVALNYLMDELVLSDDSGGEKVFDLAAFEFDAKFSPDGRANLLEFRDDLAATFLYRCGKTEILKEIILAESVNAVAVRYTLIAGAGGMLRLRPFVSLRDFHALRRAEEPSHLTYLHYHDGIGIEDCRSNIGTLHVAVSSFAGPVGAIPGQFHPDPQWWYRFCYRREITRRQEGYEDLYTPGCFQAGLAEGGAVQFTASFPESVKVDFDATVERKRQRIERLVESVGDNADESMRRLAAAGDVFIVSRSHGLPARTDSTIIAGYPWFADWGRDAMISMPGLMLETRQYESALGVLRTFAEAVNEGMVPNCFDDYGGGSHYNSIDASLWFIIAADRYVRATADEASWRNILAEPVEEILQSYRDGTRFGIHAETDGLLAGGDAQTQLTWMDAKVGDRAVTPRWGKCVEINALWHEALRIASERSEHHDRVLLFSALADRVAKAFEQTFWNEQSGCLYDCVNNEGKDASIRPNQIFAVSSRYCLLPPEKQRSIVKVVQTELLTPFGLRTLSPNDPDYRRRYDADAAAYHQGTVWPWLMGPFIEAYLKVNNFLPDSLDQARNWMAAFDGHFSQAGIGFVSEVFDGDPPYEPGGCIAQAWSIAELLRVKRLIARCRVDNR